MSEWISVKDQLPDIGGGASYLGVNCNGYIAIFNSISAQQQPPEVAPIETLTGWLTELGRTDAVIGMLTHWMPLPLPPVKA